jgi:hypothetical protein
MRSLVALVIVGALVIIATEQIAPAEVTAPDSFITTEPTTTVVAPTTTITTTTTPPVLSPPTTFPQVTVAEAPPSNDDFFACVRIRESRGDYTVSDPTGTFHGAYQIYQGGWDSVAGSMGRDDLVGVKPNMAAPSDQDSVAQAMFDQYGSKPWNGACE